MASVGWNRDDGRQKSRIGEWKERIVIQRSRAGTDKAGNHVLSWEDFYVCWAYVNNLSGKEYWEAAQVNAQKDVFFLSGTVRKWRRWIRSITGLYSGGRFITSRSWIM